MMRRHLCLKLSEPAGFTVNQKKRKQKKNNPSKTGYNKFKQTPVNMPKQIVENEKNRRRRFLKRKEKKKLIISFKRDWALLLNSETDLTSILCVFLT